MWRECIARVALSCLVLAALKGRADSNVNADAAYAWGANLGWLNWRPDPVNGVEVGQFVCSGFVYGANAGWIHLGDGAPVNGIRYLNTDSADFGVNVEGAGRLRGLAYGANIGWISFEEAGDPRVDFATGQFSGWAYGGNVGWINLGQFGVQLAVNAITPGVDADGDGIPDAWERGYAPGLAQLSASTDLDLDGQTDLQEYLADTDPTDPGDLLRVLAVALTPDRTQVSLSWSTKPTRRYLVETRRSLNPEDPWAPALGNEITADAEVTTRTIPAQAAAQFFRVRALTLF